MSSLHAHRPTRLRASVATAVVAVAALVVTLVTPGSATAAARAGAAAPRGPKPVVTSALRNDTSAPLRATARRNAQLYAQEARKRAVAPLRELATRQLPKAEGAPAPTGARKGSARVQAAAPVRGLMPDFAADFEGVDNIDGVLPPDTNGDVGGDYYVQWVNLHFQVFDKNTGASLLGPLPGNALWDGFGGPCQDENWGDPIAQYDHLADRWMMSQFALFAADGNHQCIAVSTTGDPTGTWYRYDFLVSDVNINDYPHFGVWPDAYYMSINQFDQNTFDWAGAGAVAFEREQMLAGLPAQMVSFSLYDVNPAYGGQLPADLDGFAPPDGAPGLFLEVDDDAWGFPTDQLEGWKFHVDWANPGASTFGVAGEPDFTLPVASFDADMCGFDASCVQQPGTGVGLDAISDRLMYRVQYRNFGDHQTLVLNHTVDADGFDHAGVRWYQVDSTDGGDTWAIAQQGTYAPDSDSRWMASAAMDVSGNIAVGYSVSSDTTYPSIRVAGRLASDPAGELSQGENELIAGTGSQTSDWSRWGDYSAMQVDSSDECTFYYTQEYIATTGNANWQTRVGSFKFPNCAAGPSGVVRGTITDSGTGDPIARAKVSVGSSSTRTNASGVYSIRMPVGTYDVTASAFGYYPETVPGIVVDDGVTVTQDFALDPQPLVTLSGTVVDGSGHGWPLYAKVSLPGVPVDPVFTSPITGEYEFVLPADSTYTVTATAQYPGYLPATEDVAVGSTDATHDIAMLVDVGACTALGYTINTDGDSEGFDGGLPAGWSIEDNVGNGDVWVFDDPGDRGNLTGGDGPFAMIDSDYYGPDDNQDSSLVTAPYDMSAVDSPALSFAQDYFNLGDTGDVDVSIDGGSTWQTVLHQTADRRGPRTETIPLPMAANQADVRVRFHYYDAYWAWWWEVDNVFVGSRTCDPVGGGLVVGLTTDSSGTPLNGTKVASVDQPSEFGISHATPADVNLPDGFYATFSSLTGNRAFRASNGKYKSQTKTTTVVTDAVVQLDFALRSGRVTVTPTKVVGKVRLGKKTSKTVKYTNTGDAWARVTLAEQTGTFVILGPDGERTRAEDLLAERGAPRKNIRGTFLPTFIHKGSSSPGETEQREFEADPWMDIADFPTPIMDNAMAFDAGTAYSIGGYDGNDLTAAGFAYSSTALSWSPIADAPAALEKPSAAILDGKLYLFGGWTASGDASAATYVYDPGSDTWSQVADMVTGVAAPGVAVHDGRIYVWGGCQFDCGFTDGQVYDPGSDSWSSVADYPEATSWQACGDVTGDIICAGGTASSSSSTSTYRYDSASDSWTPVADLPIDLWGMGYTAANGYLLVSGGVTDDFSTVTNEGFAYDPGSDSWSPIPNANEALYRGGSSCGFFRVGGSAGGFDPDAKAMLLPGFDQCGAPANVTWLRETPSEFSLAPGKSKKVTIIMNSRKVTQPGTYKARVRALTNTPYPVRAVNVTMKVKAPKTWGKLTGTVKGITCADQVRRLARATVQVNGRGYAQTLATGSDGTYAIWMSADIRKLRMIVAKDGYVPQTRRTDVRPRSTTTENYRLDQVGCSP